MKVGVKQL